MSTSYRALLPIDDHVFAPADDRWTAKIATEPTPEPSDRLQYGLEFQSENGERRKLILWLSDAGLHTDFNQTYKLEIYALVNSWLLSGEKDGELHYFGK